MSKKILLLGGGYTLSRLAAQLPKENFLVTSRSPEKIELFRSQGFEAAELDVADLKQVDFFLNKQSDIEIIIDSIPPIDNLLGSKNLVSVLKSYPLKHYIYLSTTGVYGETAGSIVTENHQLKPLSPKGQARLDSENLYKNLNTKLTVLRLPAISGPGRMPEDSLKRGRYPLVDNGSRWSNRIHVDDLVAVIKRLIDFDPAKVPEVLNVSNGEWIKTIDLVTALCKKYQVKMPQSMSLEDAKTKGLYTLLSNQRISNSLLRKTLGEGFSFFLFAAAGQLEKS